MHQPLMPTIAACSSTAPRVSTSSVVIEFFTHWRAFVYFQQLQDSSVLFQLPQRSPKKQTKSPQKSSKRRLNNADEDGRDESVPYGPHPQPLPRKKFNRKKEWLQPLYAVVDIASPTSAICKTPFRQDVEHALASPCRLVLAEESNVIHLTRINRVITERDAFGAQLTVFDVTFVRDESCSLESLAKLKDVYAWLTMPRTTHKDREGPAQPTEWMIDLYRFVQHPTYDFQASSCQLVNHFRVRMPWHTAERAIEAAFWSKDVDWASTVSSTDLYATVLRQIFDALCRSHPPAFGVDSVKFSKLLYEAKIQPSMLGIGDAAFLFASNITPGFTYEMDFDGFVRAVEWLSQQFYADTATKVKTSPSKALPGIQHAMMKWQLSRSNNRDHLLASLRRFCYEILVHLPSLTWTWHEIMDSWRRARKQQFLQEYALQYCAATRLRASWIGLVTWRIFSRRRQRMKEERLAVTKLQSIARERKHYLEYHRSVSRERIFVQRHVVRVLEWAGTFKFLMYTPDASDRRRYDLDASFVLSVLQFSGFRSMRLAISDVEDDDVVGADKQEADRAAESECTLNGRPQFIPRKIHRVLNGPHKVLALQSILSYVLKYGVRTPTYAMMPHIVAERERKHQERESEQRGAKLTRERQLIVMVQTHLRQNLARKIRQQLALSSYSKHFDRESGRFLYVLQYQSGNRVVLGERKPFSLFDKDVPLPPDEWQLESASDNNISFFNPRRGVYSRYNNILAATAIQRWFRGKMWNGVNHWKLRDTVHALRYQNNVQKPTNMADAGELENLKRYGLQLHAMLHQVHHLSFARVGVFAV
ncbi:hypothetical protein KRP22_000103 [Phytophthora ramorum]|nr:hypothetical protein KRP22_12049 [Phytophthora ramorum]